MSEVVSDIQLVRLAHVYYRAGKDPAVFTTLGRVKMVSGLEAIASEKCIF